MFSLKGTYIDGKIHLDEPLHFTGKADIMVTQMDLPEQVQDSSSSADFDFDIENDPVLNEDAYRDQRNQERYKAKGFIGIACESGECAYPLFDYSSGGLSFLSKDSFDKGTLLTAAIKDPMDPSSTLLDFEFEVMRELPFTRGFKVGCRFVEMMDEELWHSLMG
ncbi:MAG: PilZ domain-containing protein [SAR324 cluster bacterium]|nr:PilZ domain-containing protein [SAR324 cluster bacterium]